MELGLNGKNILITGAAKGVGRVIALTAAKEGANIALHYHSSEREAGETGKEIEAYGGKVCLVKGNLANIDDVKRMKELINNELGGVDYIVNNAGWVQFKSFFKYQPEEWKKEVDINFYGVLNLAHTFIPDMQRKNQGKLINIVGDSARTGDRNLIISAAARSGTISFLKSLAKEVGRNNIQCNIVSLGMIDQGEWNYNEETMGKIINQYPLKRLGKVEDVPGMIMFLLSDSSNWITGQVFPINGGYSMIG